MFRYLPAVPGGLLLMGICVMLVVVLSLVLCIIRLAPGIRFLAALLLSLGIACMTVLVINILTSI